MVTVIDPDEKAIKAGRKNYPEFNYISGYFPEVILEKEKFDIVSMQALFPQIPNWKEMLLSLKSITKKYLNISLTFKLNGTTVIDKDTSYFYYLDSGTRVYQVIHNIYELVNFLCIDEMAVKKIEFFGYHTPNAGHNFRSVPNSQQIKGNLMIEFFEEGLSPKRMGGASEFGQKHSDYKFFIPAMNFLIDNKQFDFRE